MVAELNGLTQLITERDRASQSKSGYVCNIFSSHSRFEYLLRYGLSRLKFSCNSSGPPRKLLPLLFTFSALVHELPASGDQGLARNRLTPNDPYMGRTAPQTSKRCILYIYSTNIGTEYFKHALYSPFFSSKCSLFHNANLFGSCIIHILYTGCAKIKKNNSGAKGLTLWRRNYLK